MLFWVTAGCPVCTDPFFPKLFLSPSSRTLVHTGVDATAGCSGCDGTAPRPGVGAGVAPVHSLREGSSQARLDPDASVAARFEPGLA